MITITFDGGTPCNIPALGYGIGYGSYKIGDGPVVRVDHKKPMSSNTAEILTLVAALEAVEPEKPLLVVGDSQIALKWVDVAAGNRKPTKIKFASPEFCEAVQRLRSMFSIFGGRKFGPVRTSWQPRLQSVAVFGH